MLRQLAGEVLARIHEVPVEGLCAIILANAEFNRRSADVKRQGIQWQLPPGFTDWMGVVDAYKELGETFERAARDFLALDWRPPHRPNGASDAFATFSEAVAACRRRLDEIMPRPA